jgi:hypothetical protein
MMRSAAVDNSHRNLNIMESERNLLKVIIYATIGGALGLFGAIIGFEHTWQLSEIDLQPIHFFIAAATSLLCGTFAAIDARSFFLSLINGLGNSGW